jgi:predicted nucleic acid-binding protein
MKVLIDTNIVLDLLLEREPFVEEAIALFEQVEAGQVHGYVAATTITNIFYIGRKAQVEKQYCRQYRGLRRG